MFRVFWIEISPLHFTFKVYWRKITYCQFGNFGIDSTEGLDVLHIDSGWGIKSIVGQHEYLWGRAIGERPWSLE